jgi:adenosylcobinamide-phosphate guanylyltransferase
MQSRTEKPMTELAGEYFIERILLALQGSGRFERILAAVSPNTPETRNFVRSTGGLETIDTLGAGYSQDLSTVLKKLAPAKVLVMPSDLPLLTVAIAQEIMDKLEDVGVPAASIAVEKSFVEDLGVTPSITFGNLCHSGITLFDTAQVKGEIRESYIIMNRTEIALNVNTKREKEIAQSLVKCANDLSSDKCL